MTDPIHWIAGLSGSLLLTILSLLGFQVRKAHSRIDELQQHVASKTVTKDELKEKLSDKLEAVKVSQEDMKRDIQELKEMLRDK